MKKLCVLGVTGSIGQNVCKVSKNNFDIVFMDIELPDGNGLDTIRKHATDFIEKRLSKAIIPNDGKQTPMHGHPVFIAEHATATCCRGCLYKWHHIPQNKELTKEEQEYIVEVIMTWINKQLSKNN